MVSNETAARDIKLIRHGMKEEKFYNRKTSSIEREDKREREREREK